MIVGKTIFRKSSSINFNTVQHFDTGISVCGAVGYIIKSCTVIIPTIQI